MLVETIDVCEVGPQLFTYSSLFLPPRTSTVIDTYVN